MREQARVGIAILSPIVMVGASDNVAFENVSLPDILGKVSNDDALQYRVMMLYSVCRRYSNLGEFRRVCSITKYNLEMVTGGHGNIFGQETETVDGSQKEIHLTNLGKKTQRH